jgi:hypothetical protein
MTESGIIAGTSICNIVIVGLLKRILPVPLDAPNEAFRPFCRVSGALPTEPVRTAGVVNV